MNSLLSLLPEHKKSILFGVLGLTFVDGIMLLVPIIIGDIVNFQIESVAPPVADVTMPISF